jgi:SAM-dependent methyltransferase
MTKTGGRARGARRSAGPERANADALARYYDLDVGDEPGDVDLYRALATQTDGPVLELAMGTGRLAIPLALDGHRVVGVDRDVAMLARARSRWARERPAAKGALKLVEADLVEVQLDDRFGLVILALNALLMLADPERQRAAVGAMTRHLRPPGGLGVIDVWLPGPDDLALYDGRLIHEWTRDDPETGERVSKSGSATYDPAMAIVELISFFDAWPTPAGALHRTERVDRLRLVTAAELKVMARDAGLTVERMAGDHDMSPFGPGSERAVLIAGLV